MIRLKNWQLPLFFVLLATGLLLSLQFHTQQKNLSELSAQKTEDLIVILNNLHNKKETLDTEISNLRTQERIFEQDVLNRKTMLETLENDLSRLEMATGYIALEGPGLTLTITNDSPIIYLDLIDIVNELWNAGAEAVAINDHRITAATSIHFNQEEWFITVNREELLFPCVIKAIGKPETLEAGLTLTGGILDNLSLYQVKPELQQEKNLKIPAAKYRPPVNHLSQVEKGT